MINRVQYSHSKQQQQASWADRHVGIITNWPMLACCKTFGNVLYGSDGVTTSVPCFSLLPACASAGVTYLTVLCRVSTGSRQSAAL